MIHQAPPGHFGACVTVGGTLAVEQYHCCQADLARDPDSAPPVCQSEEKKFFPSPSLSETCPGQDLQIYSILLQTVGTTNPQAGRPLNAVRPTVKRISPGGRSPGGAPACQAQAEHPG